MKKIVLALAVLPLFLSATPAPEKQVPTPEEFLGFPVGADKKLAGWDKLTEYIRLVEAASDRVVVEELGKSTLGKPFLMATFSSPENLKRLDEFRENQRRLVYDAASLTPMEAERIVKETPLVLMVMLNIHSTEIASSQEAFELFYDYAIKPDEELKKFFEDVILLLIPSVNPDGTQMVVDWYNEHVGTEHEGCPMPWLYHHYAGHDNNRDWYMFNLIETELVTREYYKRWFPEVILDQHQMGANGPRLFVPPFIDPINPNVDPRVFAGVNKAGHHILDRMQADGFKGIATGYIFTAWWEGASIMTPWWHNQIGILSEMASVRIATPLHFPKGSLTASERGLPEYQAQMNFLDPWQGGWWRLRDIIDYEKALTRALIELSAKDKLAFKRNFHAMNRDAIKKGETEAPYAYILPQNQHDPSALARMLKALDIGGVVIKQAEKDFITYKTADGTAGKQYAAGDYVIPMNQPFRAYAKDMLERQRYPELRDYAGGPPIAPYDSTGWTFPLQMEVKVETTEMSIDMDIVWQDYGTEPSTTFTGGTAPMDGYYINVQQYNSVFTLISRLFSANARVWRDNVGDLLYVKHSDAVLKEIHKFEEMIKRPQFNEHFSGKSISVLPVDYEPILTEIKRPRVALYEPWTTSMDAGWTRLIFDQFEIPYTVLRKEDFPQDDEKDEKPKKGKGDKKKTEWKRGGDFDVIIFPNMGLAEIEKGETRWHENAPPMPEKYRGGIGAKGIDALKDWVKGGGRLVLMGNSTELALEKFERFPAENAVKDLKRDEFFAPGSLLAVDVDTTHPLGLGMPARASVLFAQSPVFRLKPYDKQHAVVASYPKRDILQSGYLVGESRIAGLTAVADVPWGEGRVILFGPRVQHRAQTWGTFKFLFNAIYYAEIK